MTHGPHACRRDRAEPHHRQVARRSLAQPHPARRLRRRRQVRERRLVRDLHAEERRRSRPDHSERIHPEGPGGRRQDRQGTSSTRPLLEASRRARDLSRYPPPVPRPGTSTATTPAWMRSTRTPRWCRSRRWNRPAGGTQATTAADEHEALRMAVARLVNEKAPPRSHPPPVPHRALRPPRRMRGAPGVTGADQAECHLAPPPRCRHP